MTYQLGTLVDAVLYEKATEVLPGLQHGPANTTNVTFNGSSMSFSARRE